MNRAKFNELRKMAIKLSAELGLQSESNPDPGIETMLDIADELVVALDDFGYDQGYLDEEPESDDDGSDLDDEDLDP